MKCELCKEDIGGIQDTIIVVKYGGDNGNEVFDFHSSCYDKSLIENWQKEAREKVGYVNNGLNSSCCGWGVVEIDEGTTAKQYKCVNCGSICGIQYVVTAPNGTTVKIEQDAKAEVAPQAELEELKTMNIYAKNGDLVIATDRNGTDYDKEKVLKHLEVGGVYTVDHTEVSGYHTDVYLKGYTGIAFNSVNFFAYQEPEVAPQEGKYEVEKVYGESGKHTCRYCRCGITSKQSTWYFDKTDEYMHLDCIEKAVMDNLKLDIKPTEPEETTVTTTWADTNGGSGTSTMPYKPPKGVHIYNTPAMQEPEESEVEEMDITVDGNQVVNNLKFETKINSIIKVVNRLAKEIKLRSKK